MRISAVFQAKNALWPALLATLTLTNCSPHGRARSNYSGAPSSIRRDASGGISVRVKLYAGEALAVQADDFTFTPNSGSSHRGPMIAARRAQPSGRGSHTFTEEGILIPKNYFVFRSKRYSGALEARREDGQWLYVNHVPMDEYLTSVVSHEMSPQWHKEALKAQAVVARTYLLQKMKERSKKSYDVDTTTNFQVYGGRKKDDHGARAAVAETHNEVLYHGDKLAQTFFHSSCGGTLASAEEVWGKPVPYLGVQNSPYCATAPVYKWQVKIPFSEIGRRLAARGVKDLRVTERSVSKRVKMLTLVTATGAQKIRADKFRAALGALKIKSTFFGVAKHGDSIVLTGRGFGHGVGMCQWGAKIQADEKSMKYRSILDHYFPGTSLKALNAMNV